MFLTQLFNFHQASTPRLKRARLCNAIFLLRYCNSLSFSFSVHFAIIHTHTHTHTQTCCLHIRDSKNFFGNAVVDLEKSQGVLKTRQVGKLIIV